MVATLSAAEAFAIAEFIGDIDTAHDMTASESHRLWVALQARCPHPAFSDDGEGPCCDACMVPR